MALKKSYIPLELPTSFTKVHKIKPSTKAKVVAVQPVNPVKILGKAIKAAHVEEAWVRRILHHATDYLNGKDISGYVRFSAEFDGASEDAAVSIMEDAYGTLTEFVTGNPQAILLHSILYLKGKKSDNLHSFTKDFFEAEEEDKVMESIPVLGIQLGMLGRKDDFLTKKEMYLEGIDAPLIMVKCCDGEGNHEYLEGEKPSCNCEEANCGCIVNSDEDTYKYGSCGKCGSCCTTCG